MWTGVDSSKTARTNNSALRRAFTLIELLVVVAIIALLLGILLPSLSAARAQGSAVKCQANMHAIGIGPVAYSNENNDFVVPSYNLPWAPSAATNVKGGPQQPLDGWAPILDRDGLVPSPDKKTNTTFYCPRTLNVEGMKDGQTGIDPDKPRGWTDWPLTFTGVGGDSMPKVSVTIPERGFMKTMRVSYWINAYNPIGSAPASIEAADLYYTASVGLGPDARGRLIELHQLTSRRPSKFLVVADGIYMGRQSVTRLGDANSRIGYRHPGLGRGDGVANVAFADGHIESMPGDRFPQALGGSDAAEVVARKKLENLSGFTVYSDPETAFP